MRTQVIPPVNRLSEWLSDGFARHSTCLITAAYLDYPGALAIIDSLKARLTRPRAYVRVLFQDHGFRTDPEAVRILLNARRGRPGTLALRYAGPKLRKFHAKAYGFRRAHDCEVIVGSSNATDKALGPDSGEINVFLAGAAADDAWAIMEGFWTAALDVDRSWLKTYARAHERYRRLAAEAEALVARWRGPGRSARKKRDAPWSGRVVVEHTYPFEGAEQTAHQRRVRAAKRDGLDIPAQYISTMTRAEATRIAKQGQVLDVYWRRRDKPNRGLRSMAFIRLGGVQKIGNSRLGQRWLVDFTNVRGTKIALPHRNAERVQKLLRKHGLTYASLERVCGRLRARHETVKSVYTELRTLVRRSRP